MFVKYLFSFAYTQGEGKAEVCGQLETVSGDQTSCGGYDGANTVEQQVTALCNVNLPLND